MNFYISDTHFGHANIMEHCNRQFKNVEEMDEFIIKNWNNVVSKNDNVYFLGDFTMKSGRNPKEYLDKLNGHKHLIVGNHDSSIVKDPVCRRCFDTITKEALKIRDGEYTIILYHYPIVEWDGYFRGVLHFYGHVHNNVENLAYSLLKQIPNAYNVGADILGFTPRTAKEVIELNKKFFKEN